MLHGIIVPIVTPLSGADALDVATLERLVEHLILGGVHGLFLLGTCGEGPSLSYQTRRELIWRTCHLVDGRAPIVVAITDPSPVESTAMAAHAADSGADAVVLAPPFYFPLDSDELIRYVRGIAHRSALPVVLYNMPALTKIAFDAECVRRLMDEEKIIGLKDSSGDLGFFELLIGLADKRVDWSFLVGSEHLLVPSLQLGGHGGVCGGANVFPELFATLFTQATHGSTSGLNALWDYVLKLGELYEIAGGGATSGVKCLKAALAVVGFGNGLPADPLSTLTQDDFKKVVALVTNLGRELSTLRAEVGTNQFGDLESPKLAPK